MANQIKSLEAFLSNDAEFRTWCAEIIDGITDLGLVQTADTGQIDTGTVARPGTSTYAGYAIFRFADALQATSPVFIKLEFGIGAAADRPALRSTVSSSTNGAGTPSGQISSVKTAVCGTSKVDEDVLNTYFSGHTGQLILFANFDPSSKNFAEMLVVSRTLDADATPNGAGVFHTMAIASGMSYQYVPATGTIPAAVTVGFPGCARLDYGARSKQGTQVGIDFFTIWDGLPYAQDALGCYQAADIGELTPITFEHLGVSRDWMPLGDGTSSTLNMEGNATTAFVIPWD